MLHLQAITRRCIHCRRPHRCCIHLDEAQAERAASVLLVCPTTKASLRFPLSAFRPLSECRVDWTDLFVRGDSCLTEDFIRAFDGVESKEGEWPYSRFWAYQVRDAEGATITPRPRPRP
jgi:hypothetical protein